MMIVYIVKIQINGVKDDFSFHRLSRQEEGFVCMRWVVACDYDEEIDRSISIAAPY